MTEIDLIKQWFQHALNDLLVAKQCIEKMYPQQTEIACYLAQQCAENAVESAQKIYDLCTAKYIRT